MLDSEKIRRLIRDVEILNHDIKHILTNILMRASSIKMKVENLKFPGAKEITEILDDIESDSRAIEKNIENYETVLFEEKFKEKLGYKKLDDIFKEAVSRFADLREDKTKIKISYEGIKNLSVLADSRLITIFTNLLDNSLRHAENLSEIKLYCKKGEDEITIVYEDNGIGIAKENKEKIFKTSIGLWFVKEVCEIYYGWSIKETGEAGKNFRLEISIRNNRKIKRRF